MANKKKVRTKRKKAEGRICWGCKEVRLLPDFIINKKLEGGLTPWCASCLEKLHESGTHARRKEYRAAYQRSYHNRRRAVEGVSRTVTRGARRLSKAILARRIPRELTLEAVRRESVQRDLLALMPALKKTKVWMGFEDTVIADYENENVKCENGITRVLPIENYPELALVPKNCIPITKGMLDFLAEETTLCLHDIALGLTRLAGCVLEVLGCDVETETV